MRAMSSPVTILMSTGALLRSLSAGAMPLSTSTIICGFTPRKMWSASRAMISLLLTTAPMRSASVSAFAFVRLASSTSTSPLLAAALASAPPIFPVPIKPIFIICRVLSTPIRSPSAALYRAPPLFLLSVKDISTPAALSSTAPVNHPFRENITKMSIVNAKKI